MQLISMASDPTKNVASLKNLKEGVRINTKEVGEFVWLLRNVFIVRKQLW